MSALVFGLCVGCAGLMGYAIQRGATCTVAAVDELINQKRATRLSAMLEASMWVLGGLLLAASLQSMPRLPAAFGLTGMTLAGAALLGLGAMVNRGCVFGTLARLGTGERSYLATPIGFLIGSLLFWSAGWMPAPKLSSGESVLPSSAIWVAMVLLVVIARVVIFLRYTPVSEADPALRWTQKLWMPHHATLVIGITFFVMFMLAGPWAYTDVLAEWAASLTQGARGMTPAFLERMVLVLALFGGAVFGGLSTGRYAVVPITPPRLARCFAGGALMGVGSALIPGGNDGLVLMGLPMLFPFAWAAFLTMCASIALAMTARKRWPMALGWL